MSILLITSDKIPYMYVARLMMCVSRMFRSCLAAVHDDNDASIGIAIVPDGDGGVTSCDVTT